MSRMAASDNFINALKLAAAGTIVGAPALAAGVDVFDQGYDDLANEVALNALIGGLPTVTAGAAAGVMASLSPAARLAMELEALPDAKDLSAQERARIGGKLQELVQRQREVTPKASENELMGNALRGAKRKFYGALALGGLAGVIPAVQMMQDAPAVEGRGQ